MDKELKAKLQQWKVQAPPVGLAEKIVMQAVMAPQNVRLGRLWQQSFIAAFSDWKTGFVYKFAGLVLCAILGFSTGWQMQKELKVDITSVAFGGVEEGENL